MYETLIKQLTFEEGNRLVAYNDTKGIKTIGVGHNLNARPFFQNKKISNTITDELCTALLLDDIATAASDIRKSWVGFRELCPARQEAIINMVFQLGLTTFMKFRTMIYALDQKKWQLAHDSALNSLWAKECPNRAARVCSQLLTGEYYKVPLS